MPGTMFQDVVSSPARQHRRWYTLPLSFLIHTTLIAITVAVPLIATDVPVPRTILRVIHSDAMPVVPAPPPAIARRDIAAPAAPQQSAGAPVVAPDAIGAESGVTFQEPLIATEALDGIVRGLGAPQGTFLEPPAPRPQPDVPVRPGAGIKLPVRTRYVAPEYPEIARNARVEGIVIIEAIIGIDGSVENARVLRSSPLLDNAALKAVRGWKYTPTLLNGRPTAVIMTVTVRFDLN